jgi:GH15 family glucan-1,4-alpha-glucosidase
MLMKTLKAEYTVLEQLRLPHGLFLASSSSDYGYVWIRDSVYMALPYRDKSCGTYELTVYRLLDLFKDLEDKITYHTQHKPRLWYEYIHARYSAHDLSEIGDHEWGHAQHDSIGAFLYMVGTGFQYGRKVIRDQSDLRIIQKLVNYLITLEFWNSPDNGMWEEYLEVHSSSVGAVTAGLLSVRNLIHLPDEYIKKGMLHLLDLLPNESPTKSVDLAQLSLIYPYNIIPDYLAREIVEKVEQELLRERGVARYYGDSYYSTLEEQHGRGRSRSFYAGSEAEWTFGIPWLSLCHLQLGNKEMARRYLEWSEKLTTSPGVFPELYYAGTNKPNPNTPLGWSSSMHILATERFLSAK